ncbi:MAG: hypothetical protein WA921_03975, partial [Ahrensia sp.]
VCGFESNARTSPSEFDVEAACAAPAIRVAAVASVIKRVFMLVVLSRLGLFQFGRFVVASGA